MDVSGYGRPGRRLRATRRLLGILALALVVVGVGASSAAAKKYAGGPATCSGTPGSPGVLSGPTLRTSPSKGPVRHSLGR
jgi:hypothetical protein